MTVVRGLSTALSGLGALVFGFVFFAARADWTNRGCADQPLGMQCSDAVNAQWFAGSLALICAVGVVLGLRKARDA